MHQGVWQLGLTMFRHGPSGTSFFAARNLRVFLSILTKQRVAEARRLRIDNSALLDQCRPLATVACQPSPAIVDRCQIAHNPAHEDGSRDRANRQLGVILARCLERLHCFIFFFSYSWGSKAKKSRYQTPEPHTFFESCTCRPRVAHDPAPLAVYHDAMSAKLLAPGPLGFALT